MVVEMPERLQRSYTATGNSCNFINDYDYVCPYSGSTSADVVYAWVATAGGTGAITVDLCASVYDTKVYVYNSSMAVIACNDDYCSFQSIVSNVPVTVGATYYIVVDGYGGSCGTYNMLVDWYTPCSLECAPGAMLEGEPICYDGYDDQYNGGCNTLPFPVFQIIDATGLDITICGTTGVYPMDTTTYRDTDWFQMDITTSSYICLSGDAEVPCYFFIIDGRGGCTARRSWLTASRALALRSPTFATLAILARGGRGLARMLGTPASCAVRSTT